MDLIDDLRARGLFHQTTDEEGLREAFSKGVVTGYIGFDPTAPSLHVGSLLQILNLVRLQRAGHRPVVVVGGGTGLIGDPSGKRDERTMLTRDDLALNLAGIRAQLEKYLDFDAPPNAAVMVDNADWLCAFNLVDFLRDVGKEFSINAMLARDAVKDRLATGISFTEFSYMLLQAYDFLALHDRLGCTLQLGGSDQWGNIISGIDLIRSKRGAKSFGLTVALVTNSDGTKMGKTERGAIWLDPQRTSPYEFYQFWLRTLDADVERYLNFFTFLSAEEIAAVVAKQAAEPERRHGHRRLAEEVTRFVHGEAAFESAEATTEVFFGGESWRGVSERKLRLTFGGAPSTHVEASTLGTAEGSLLQMLVRTGLYPSKSQARTGILQGGVSINNAPETDPQRVLTAADLLHGAFVVLTKGKKNHHVIRLG